MRPVPLKTPPRLRSVGLGSSNIRSAVLGSERLRYRRLRSHRDLPWKRLGLLASLALMFLAVLPILAGAALKPDDMRAGYDGSPVVYSVDGARRRATQGACVSYQADRSGSVREADPDRQSLKEIVEAVKALDDHGIIFDRGAITIYADTAWTTGMNRHNIVAQADLIEDGVTGEGTSFTASLTNAAKVLSACPAGLDRRLIIVSDGAFNETQSEMDELIEALDSDIVIDLIALNWADAYAGFAPYWESNQRVNVTRLDRLRPKTVADAIALSLSDLTGQNITAHFDQGGNTP